MSVKAQTLVWDFECPTTVNGMKFKPNHKYVLVCYADNADHWGKNIWPAIPTIAKKTGYKERNVQRLTHQLENMGLLIPDGMGPRGTNKWRLPYNEGGDKLTPLSSLQGVKNDKSLGDSSSGDSSSGVKLTPELKGTEPVSILINNTDIGLVWGNLKNKIKNNLKRAEWVTWVEPTQAYDFEERTLIVIAANSRACTWLDANLKTVAQDELGLYVKFITLADVEDE
jgi:hypothetical protein